MLCFLTRKLILHVRETLSNERSPQESLVNLWLSEYYSWKSISQIKVNQWGNLAVTNFQRFKITLSSKVIIINIVNIISSFTQEAVKYLTVFWHCRCSLTLYSAINVLGYTQTVCIFTLRRKYKLKTSFYWCLSRIQELLHYPTCLLRLG